MPHLEQIDIISNRSLALLVRRRIPYRLTDAIAIGTVFDDVYQQNRMIVIDCEGNSHIFYFTEHHSQMTKTAAGTWQMTEL
jgi:hypothetical protein